MERVKATHSLALPQIFHTAFLRLVLHIPPLRQKITQPSCSTPTGSLELTGLPVTGNWIITQMPGEIAFSGKDWIAQLQKTEREKTGISSLKVKYNKVSWFTCRVHYRFANSVLITI